MFDPESLPVPDLGLRCMTCQYPLAGLPSHRCPECGGAFTMDEHVPPGDFAILYFRGKEVPKTPEVTELLRVMGIPGIDTMRPGDTLYGFGGATHTRSRVAVPRDMYFVVIDALRRRELGEPLESFGSVEEDERPDWVCSGCGEENPGTFEVCWHCEREK